jgi:hypothetical protein
MCRLLFDHIGRSGTVAALDAKVKLPCYPDMGSRRFSAAKPGVLDARLPLWQFRVDPGWPGHAISAHAETVLRT